ncbi:MAG: prolyl-tRNA synthetase associated domain-containing protein [Alphaproteobacteria bacterium]|nr:prolyl-tRNA synthetase associated domain-containing protein [Alphaproteobacteria bacterium]
MPVSREQLFARLAELGIEATTLDHEPVMTVAESEHVTGHLPGVHTKNLFLRDEKGALFLVTAPWERQIKINQLHKLLGCKRLSFGNAELLMDTLGVTPGSVTALAPINDTAGRVTVVLDKWLAGQELVNCHPLTNTATTTLKTRDLIRFLEATGHPPKLVPLEATLAGGAPADGN